MTRQTDTGRRPGRQVAQDDPPLGEPLANVGRGHTERVSHPLHVVGTLAVLVQHPPRTQSHCSSVGPRTGRWGAPDTPPAGWPGPWMMLCPGVGHTPLTQLRRPVLLTVWVGMPCASATPHASWP